MHRESLYIYHNAEPETQVYYKKGHYIAEGIEENWIIKWLLWHVFRYRDSRNHGKVGPISTSRNPTDPQTPVGASEEIGPEQYPRACIAPLMSISYGRNLSALTLSSVLASPPVSLARYEQGSLRQEESITGKLRLTCRSWKGDRS